MTALQGATAAPGTMPPAPRPDWDRGDGAAPAGSSTAATAGTLRHRVDGSRDGVRGTPEVTVTTTLHHMPVAAFVEIDGPWHHRYVAANGALPSPSSARGRSSSCSTGSPVLVRVAPPDGRCRMPAFASPRWTCAAMGVGQAARRRPAWRRSTPPRSSARSVRRPRWSSGQGLGGWIARAMPLLRPDVTTAIASLSMPHPRVLRRASWLDRKQRRVRLDRGVAAAVRSRARDDAVP